MLISSDHEDGGEMFLRNIGLYPNCTASQRRTADYSAIMFPNSSNRLVFVMVTRCVFCEVESEILIILLKWTSDSKGLRTVIFGCVTFLWAKCGVLMTRHAVAHTGFGKLIFVKFTFYMKLDARAGVRSVFTLQRTQHNTTQTTHCTSLSGYILHVQWLNKPSGCSKLNLLHIKWLVKCGRNASAPVSSVRRKLPPLLLARLIRIAREIPSWITETQSDRIFCSWQQIECFTPQQFVRTTCFKMKTSHHFVHTVYLYICHNKQRLFP